MFWKKKKSKRKQPVKKKKQIPKHIAEGFKEDISQASEKPSQKNPAGKKLEKQINPRKEFLKVFNRLAYRHNRWNVWSDFILMYACALSNPIDKSHFDERESLYLHTIKRYNKQEQPLFSELAAYVVLALEENPEQDFLGGLFMEMNLGNEHKGQFFTPYHVCELMAEITLDNVVQKVKNDGYISICDPCCGAGANLIAGVYTAKKRLEKAGLNFQNHVLVVGQDIDMTVGLMCYIQISLLGIAGYIKIGNTLTEPMTENDSTENYWFTPMYFSDIWTTRRLLRRL